MEPFRGEVDGFRSDDSGLYVDSHKESKVARTREIGDCIVERCFRRQPAAV